MIYLLLSYVYMKEKKKDKLKKRNLSIINCLSTNIFVKYLMSILGVKQLRTLNLPSHVIFKHHCVRKNIDSSSTWHLGYTINI